MTMVSPLLCSVLSLVSIAQVLLAGDPCLNNIDIHIQCKC